ncbi:MAG TPA: hypothetical protein VGP48_12490 [Stellaceae bacterium]|jgi:hypothetical protein|nr:hypothetical protein [Stellaceae bacterium]
MTVASQFGTVIAGQRLSPDVMASLREAAAKTGVNFDFLVAQASLESGFRGNAHADKGSATGLFQFTGSTWLRMMHDHGGQYGYADLAKSVKLNTQGAAVVADKPTERRILELRSNNQLSALFAAEYAKTNGNRLETVTGHKATPAELHLAHLLGPNGAIRFIKAHDINGGQSAAKVVPEAARENPGLFYSRGSNTARSVATVYRNIQDKLNVPLRQVAELEKAPLRPALGLSDNLPRPRTDRRA